MRRSSPIGSRCPTGSSHFFPRKSDHGGAHSGWDEHATCPCTRYRSWRMTSNSRRRRGGIRSPRQRGRTPASDRRSPWGTAGSPSGSIAPARPCVRADSGPGYSCEVPWDTDTRGGSPEPAPDPPAPPGPLLIGSAAQPRGHFLLNGLLQPVSNPHTAKLVQRMLHALAALGHQGRQRLLHLLARWSSLAHGVTPPFRLEPPPQVESAGGVLRLFCFDSTHL